MKDKVKDLSLLLISLTGWEEDSRNEPGTKVNKAWTGYSFDVLNELEAENLIVQFRGNAKTLILTKEGQEKALTLKQNYLQQ